MAIPVKQTPHSPVIQSASDNGSIYQATLQDGTILWIPKAEGNKDRAEVLAWADAEKITL